VAFSKALDHGEEFPGIDMKEHDLLEAITGDPIILCEGEEVFDSRLRSAQEMFLKVYPAFLATSSLKYGFESLILQGATGSHGIGHQSLNLQFRNGQGIDPTPNALHISNEILDPRADGRLNFRSNDKSLLL
jgi:hypothetical protein